MPMLFQPQGNVLVPGMQPQFGRGRVSGGGEVIQWITAFTEDYDTSPEGALGIKLTNGSQDIEIDEVALWGNTGQYSSTITVYVYQGGSSLGSADVDTPSGSGANNAWNWKALSSPIAIGASEVFYVTTAALAYNTISRATVTAAEADITLSDVCYGLPPADEGTGSNKNYGPLNIKYRLV